MLFGKQNEKGLVYDEASARFTSVTVGPEHPVHTPPLHDETNLPRAIALAALEEPVALGVLYAKPAVPERPGLSRIEPTPIMTRAELAALLSATAGS
jgi:hypothetical protein